MEPEPGGSAGPDPSFGFASFTPVPELEALLPDTLGGQPVTKSSASGRDIALIVGSSGDPTIGTFLTDVGASPEDTAIAFGIAGADPVSATAVTAFRIGGADPAALLGQYLAAADATVAGGVETASVTVGGKQVLLVTNNAVTVGPNTFYLYASGVTLFFVQSAAEALAAEAISALP